MRKLAARASPSVAAKLLFICCRGRGRFPRRPLAHRNACCRAMTLPETIPWMYPDGQGSSP
eukprot:scaffold91141_cov15-Prasinocladus_malaysianus.AAC.1